MQISIFADEPTLTEAKQLIRDNFEKGVICPCCEQFVKLYFRKLNSAMAYVLILMFKSGVTDYFHIENWLKEQNTPASLRGDFPKLRYWQLIEPMLGVRNDGSKRVGMYRITELGKSFARGECLVPEKAKLFNQKFYGLDGNQISITDALGNKFNYRELMQ